MHVQELETSQFYTTRRRAPLQTRLLFLVPCIRNFFYSSLISIVQLYPTVATSYLPGNWHCIVPGRYYLNRNVGIKDPFAINLDLTVSAPYVPCSVENMQVECILWSTISASYSSYS